MDFQLLVCPTGECELARACIGPNGDVCEVPTSLILHRWSNRKLSVILWSPPGDCLSCPNDLGLVLMSQ